MSKYKVCVYAISKNEEKFVDRWVNSVKEADEIYVLDTGSTDNTFEELKKRNVKVKSEIIDPWRFDVARNKSLDLVPQDADICVCLDLDEVLESGWREKLEKAWNDNVTRARYNYNWSFDEYGKPSVNFYIEKIHNRHDYKWTHPVHEVLTYIGKKQEKFITIDDITVNHYPDATKSRGSYLPLLELSVKEDPLNDRNMHYLGREYMYYGKWNECIDTLIKHLSLKSAIWKDERAASMRFISRAYIGLGRYEEAKMWLSKAIKEAPYLRDAYVEKAMLHLKLEEYEEAEKNCLDALKIERHTKTYINEPFSWDHTIYDILSVCTFYQKKYQESLDYSSKALEISPDNERLIKNNELIKSFLNK